MVDKTRVLKLCILEQEKKIRKLEKSFESTKEGAISAVASMVSWSDTTKFQMGNLASGIEKRLGEARLALHQLKRINLTDDDFIRVGSLFVLKDTESGEIFYYLLIPEGGGNEFDVDGKEVMAVSVASPIVKAVLDKKVGEIVAFRSKTIEIIEVQ